MPPRQVDPARLEGEALRSWYSRTPDEVQRERQAAASARHSEFLGGAAADELAKPGYGRLRAPPTGDLVELRRQQAEFDRTRREIGAKNSWLAVPALAPAAAVFGLEAAAAAAAAAAARFAAPIVAAEPLVLTERAPYLRVGDNWATSAGRRAHQALKVRVDAKPGWEPELAVKMKGGLVRPDVSGPVRNLPRPGTRYQMELKPGTPSGRRAAARAIARYTRETPNKTRAIYYNPKDFM